MSDPQVIQTQLEKYVDDCISNTKYDLDEYTAKALGAIDFCSKYLNNIDTSKIQEKIDKFIEETF